MTRIVNTLEWTHEAWLSLAKAAEPGITGNSIPMIEVDLETFKASLHLDGSHADFVLHIPADEKKRWFEQCGFDVLTLAHSIITVDRFLTMKEHGPSIEQQFIDKQRNVFIVNANHWDKDFFAVLEYSSADKLANYTVDYAALAKREADRARTKAFMDKIRNKK